MKIVDGESSSFIKRELLSQCQPSPSTTAAPWKDTLSKNQRRQEVVRPSKRAVGLAPPTLHLGWWGGAHTVEMSERKQENRSAHSSPLRCFLRTLVELWHSSFLRRWNLFSTFTALFPVAAAIPGSENCLAISPPPFRHLKDQSQNLVFLPYWLFF